MFIKIPSIYGRKYSCSRNDVDCFAVHDQETRNPHLYSDVKSVDIFTEKKKKKKKKKSDLLLKQSNLNYQIFRYCFQVNAQVIFFLVVYKAAFTCNQRNKNTQ